MEFSELNLHPDLKRGIADMGYLTCMPVQEQVLGCAFGGQDLYVQSQTGTGKTAAFLIVIFQRLLAEAMLGGKKAIIMVPTRELAVQVEVEAKALGKYLPFKTGSFYGGVGYAQQQQLLRDNVQILVGTPGRVLDLNKSGHMNLMDIAFLVLDEADRMFDMGFYPDLRKLIKVIPSVDRRQTMLFSATLNAWVKNLAWEYTKNPKEIEIEPETVTVDEVEQILYHVPSEDKIKLLLGILKKEQPESAVIFCNTKRYTEIIARRLRINGIECEFIIGDLPQVKRLKIIDDIKSGKTRFLVATDVAARGLDIEGLALVVNFDIPAEAENYVHRIGRTARAGKTGKAFTLASEQDVYELPDIEKYIGKKIPSQIADGSLYGEDKSEGVRIKTDFYDDRDSRGSGRGDGRRRESVGRGRGREGGGREHSREGGRISGAVGRARSPGRGESGGRNVRGGRSGERGTEQSGAGQNEALRDGAAARGGQVRGKPRNQEKPAARRDLGRPRTPNLSALSFDERMSYYKEKYSGNTDAPDTAKTARKHSARRGGAAQASGAKPAAPATNAPAPNAAGAEKPKRGLLGAIKKLFGKKEV